MRSTGRWAVAAALLARAAAATDIGDSRQIVLVAAESAEDVRAEVSVLEKGPRGWTAVLKRLPAVIGKKGLALGLGLHGPDFPAAGLPPKIEGDLKSPAGVFRIGDAYGYAAKPPRGLKLKYTRLMSWHEGVDDSESKFYNRIVDTRGVPKDERVWKSHETMRRQDDLYKWLAVIGHNERNVPGKGSLIFLHVWRGPGSGTAGCAAMSEENLLKVLRRLDPDKKPVLVALTAASAAAWKAGLQREAATAR